MPAVKPHKPMPILVIALPTLMLLAVLTRSAWAVPPFARKYRTSCVTCHEVFPRLNATGEAFRLNGYKFSDDELYIKDEPVKMGAEGYKSMWPKAIWPADIPGLPPLGLMIKSEYHAHISGKGDARTEFTFPDEVELFGAGALGDSMSFFVELGFDRGGDETETDVEGWLQFEDILGPENMLNLRVGTVGMHEMGLFTARDHNRIPVNGYLYSMSAGLPAPGAAAATGLMPIVGTGGTIANNAYSFRIHPEPGLELNGFGRWWRYAVGVVNGNGEEVHDNNSDKDVYVQLAFKIGGIGFDGSGAGGGDRESLDTPQPWRDDSVILSLFGWRGTGRVDVTGDSGSFEYDDDFWRVGAGAQWKFRDLTLRCGYIIGRNDNPYAGLTDKSVNGRWWFVGGEYFVYPWLIPHVRFEGLQLDLPSGVPGLQTNQDRARIVAGVKALIRANVTLNVEGRFYTKNEQFTKANPTGDQNDDDEIVASLSAAF